MQEQILKQFQYIHDSFLPLLQNELMMQFHNSYSKEEGPPQKGARGFNGDEGREVIGGKGDPDGTSRDGYMEEETAMGEAWDWGDGMDQEGRETLGVPE